MPHSLRRVGRAATVLFLLGLSTAVFAQPADAQGDASQDASKDVSEVFDASFHDLHDWESMQSLSQWEGKTLVLNFWATWCKSCHYEVPELNKLYHKYEDQGAVVVGIAVDNTDKVRDYVKKYSVDYPILVGGDKALALSEQVGNKIGALPYTVVITPDKRLAKTFIGTTEKGELSRGLTPLLEDN